MSKKDEYVEKLKTKLDELNTDLDELEEKLHKTSVGARITYEEQMRSFRQKRDEIQRKLMDIHGAGEDGWEELKQGTENAWSVLKESISKAKSEFERGYREGSKG
jgi:chromosome segregation ATPase